MSAPIYYDPATGAVLLVEVDPVYNPLPDGWASIDIEDAERAKLATAFSSFTVDPATRIITATHDATAQQTAQGEQTAAIETAAAKSDLATNYQAGLNALDQILAATSMTNAQLFNAVQAEARILKRTLRLLKAALT